MSLGADQATREAPPSSPEAGLRRIFLNALSLLLAYGLPRVLTFGAVVVAARVLGTSLFGAYGTAAALAVILSIVATAGMMPLLIRDIAREPEKASELVGAAHGVKLGSTALMLAALWVVARWMLHYPGDVVAAAMLLGVAYAVGAFVENLSAYFQAVERMHVWMQASAVYGLVTGAVGATVVLVTQSVVWFCAAPIAGQAAALSWLLFRTPTDVRTGRGGWLRGSRRLVRSLAPFAAAFVALTVYYKVDVLLLARWRTPHDVGIYAAAYKFVDITQALVIVAVAAVYPRLSRVAPRSGDADRWAGTRVTELALLAIVPVAASVWLIRAPLIHALYGLEYATSSPVLGVLAPVLPALAVNILAGYVLGATGKMMHVAVSYAGALAVNVGLNALLIPILGPRGAGLAMLGSETALALVLLGVLRAKAAAWPNARTLAMVAGATLLWIVSGTLPDPSGGPLALTAYLALVTLLYWRGGAVPRSEWTLVHRAIRPLLAGGAGARAWGAGT